MVAWHNLDGASGCDPEEVDRAIRVVTAFREVHAYPMLKIRMGVRSFCYSEHTTAYVTQRLKRVPRIVRKLHRMEHASLARLEDIGGVRAVVADGTELERVRTRIGRTWGNAFAREPRDYIADPKIMGYRAVHIVVQRDGRAVEVQLRTQGQQQWAEAVEAADARLNLNLKDGVGPADMMEFFEVTGDMIYLREYGFAVPDDLSARYAAARAAVVAAGYYSG